MEQPPREAAPGIGPAPAHAGTDARDKADLPWKGRSCQAANIKVYLGEGEAGSSGTRWQCDEADDSEFRLAGWELCTSGQQTLILFMYQSPLVLWARATRQRISVCVPGAGRTTL